RTSGPRTSTSPGSATGERWPRGSIAIAMAAGGASWMQCILANN
uniref:Uncharacterized protein n=1 Tax=Aegilops tauschii subsp. strangulata TaxID=200361 RepID=A0A453JEH0_AEGTS